MTLADLSKFGYIKLPGNDNRGLKHIVGNYVSDGRDESET